jgi:predicted  nucleic acid-binding Zn-ribbon protein
VKADLSAEEKKSANVKESVGRQRGDLEEKSIALQSRLEELAKQRAELATTIDEDLLARFERLFKSKGDAVVVPLEHEVCTGCHMKVTTQTAHRVKAAKEIMSCENCGRILYDAA